MTVPRIDTHCHIVPSFYADASRDIGAIPARGGYPDWSPEQALDLMDANEIDLAVTTLVPGVQFFPPAQARELARRINEFAAEMCARWPTRFAACALVPMHNAEQAIEEIEYALDELKFVGVGFLTNYDNRYLGDAEFDPVLQVLDQRRAVAVIHPYFAGRHMPGNEDKIIPLPYPAFMLEYPFDTIRMATHLMFSGAIERFPNIRFILPHAGGALPYFAWRLYISQDVDPTFPQWTYDEIRAGLRHFWYDTAMSAGPEMLACLISMVGLERVIFGSDWPMANKNAVAKSIANLSQPDFLDAAGRDLLARGNALKLFPGFSEN